MPRCCSARSRPGRQRSAAGSSSRTPSPASAKAGSPIPSATRMRTPRSSSPRSGRPQCSPPGGKRRGRREGSCSPSRDVLLQLGVLAQSRGSLPAFALALALYLALVPDRARSLLTLLTIGAATALSAGRLLEVYRADPGEDLQQALASAKTALVLTAVCLAAAGVAIGLLERRRGSVPTAAPRLRRLVVASVLVLGLAAAVTIVSSGPTSRLGDGLASGRYDLWRVAALEFADHPVQGVGADNFAVGLRARTERPRGAALSAQHRVEAPVPDRARGDGPLRRVPRLRGGRRSSEPEDRCDTRGTRLGRSRLLLLLVRPRIDRLVLGGPGTRRPGIRRARARRRHVARGADAGGPAATAAAGDHGHRRRGSRHSFDLACTALACGAGRRGCSRELGEGSRRSIRPTRARSSAQRAQRRARRRRRGSRAARRRSRAGKRGPSARALDRAPEDWYAHAALALVDLEAGRRTAALEHLRHAHRLNPLERTTRALLAVALRSEPVPASLAERLDRRAVSSPLGRRPVDCRPVLGLSAVCADREGRP